MKKHSVGEIYHERVAPKHQADRSIWWWFQGSPYVCRFQKIHRWRNRTIWHFWKRQAWWKLKKLKFLQSWLPLPVKAKPLSLMSYRHHLQIGLAPLMLVRSWVSLLCPSQDSSDQSQFQYGFGLVPVGLTWGLSTPMARIFSIYISFKNFCLQEQAST